MRATHQIPAATTTTSRLTLPELAYTAIAVTVLACGVVFLVQLVAGWFAPAEMEGVCREYSNAWVVCAPAVAPSGAELVRMWEDGSAVYSDGSVFGGYGEE